MFRFERTLIWIILSSGPEAQHDTNLYDKSIWTQVTAQSGQVSHIKTILLDRFLSFVSRLLFFKIFYRFDGWPASCFQVIQLHFC